MMFSEMEKNVILRTLRRHNPFISHIIDSASQVEAYKHNLNTQTEELIAEGTLFVYSSYVRPYYGFIVLNPLNQKSLFEPVQYSCMEFFNLESHSLKYTRYDNMTFEHCLSFANKGDGNRIGHLLLHLMEHEEDDAKEKQDLAYRTRHFEIYEIDSDEEFEEDILDEEVD